MNSTHQLIFGDAKTLAREDQSVDLVVTSPPYPMIEMWDGTFAEQDPGVKRALQRGRGALAFARMHQLLDDVWGEIYRVLRPGGFACINIGDAARTMSGHFQLYPNHARVLTHCVDLGFLNLPAIVWRKPTNAPNKFMGSGMLPAGAYVTLEHEFLLILRKSGKRQFTTGAEKLNRLQSALFWEERNSWFSDVWWDLKGVRQTVNGSPVRRRSGAFPFEIPYRLINMFSVRGDTVLDPFLGTGTTMLAAAASHRNSVGVERNRALQTATDELLTKAAADRCNERVQRRITDHLNFVQTRRKSHGRAAFKYRNRHYGFPVMTRQETDLYFDCLAEIQRVAEDTYTARYAGKIAEPHAGRWHDFPRMKTTASPCARDHRDPC
jgi:DNA modification methylase